MTNEKQETVSNNEEITLSEELQGWLEHTEVLVSDLIADGSNQQKLHTIEHHFSSSNFDLLEKAAVAAFKSGLDVEEPEEAELETGEKVFAFDIVSELPLDFDVIFEETVKMYELAQQSNIDYDGWGTYFEE